LPVKLKLANNSRPTHSVSLGWRVARALIVVVLAVMLVGACVFGYFYHHYETVVDDRLAAGPLFANVAQIYAAPREIRNGQKMTADPHRAGSAPRRVQQQHAAWLLRGQRRQHPDQARSAKLSLDGRRDHQHCERALFKASQRRTVSHSGRTSSSRN